MAEDSPNPESSQPSEQDQPDASATPPTEGDAQSPRKSVGDEGAKDADHDSTDSAESIAEEALESAERATEEIRSQAGLSGDETPGDDSSEPAASGQEGDTPGTDRLDLPDFAERAARANGQTASGAGYQVNSDLGLLNDIDLDVTVELGRTEMFVEDVLRLNENSIVELDKAAGDPVDIYVNNRHVARGEVLVLNENFCVRISEIINQNLEE